MYFNIYEYTENRDLNILNFENATEEWLKFVFKNRQSDELVYQYDIVIGSVADDNLYQILVSYENGIYDMEETKMWYYSNYDLFRMFLEERNTGSYTVYGG